MFCIHMERVCIFRCQNTQDSWDGTHISTHDGVAAGVSGRTCSRQPLPSRVSSLLLYKSRAEAYTPDYHPMGLALPRPRERETRERRRGRGATQPAEPRGCGAVSNRFFLDTGFFLMHIWIGYLWQLMFEILVRADSNVSINKCHLVDTFV